ncbi:MAG: AAA family ATPase [Acidimicrobiales bacterium]
MTERPMTLGDLRRSGYEPRSVKEEIRANVIERIRNGLPLVDGMVDYEDSVLPEVERALLAGHDIVFLGERGQGKSRLIRTLPSLLDEFVPAIEGAELNDDPLLPLSVVSQEIVGDLGDSTPVRWLGRDERYSEKLATPDTSIADLVGEIDPIKVAQGRYLSDEKTMHFGLVPRTNRGIFAINELPDLPERIQVGLLNLLEERDVQVRGYKIRLPMDLLFVASANPDDYTNRGRLITPLKDRFGSQIRTHYPRTIEGEITVMRQEAVVAMPDGFVLTMPSFMEEIIATIAALARRSPSVNQRSGVSVRLSVASYEIVVASALSRAIRTGTSAVVPRPSDLVSLAPAVSGKIEIDALEDADETKVIDRLTAQAISAVFRGYIDGVDTHAAQIEVEETPFVCSIDYSDAHYEAQLESYPALRELAQTLVGVRNQGVIPAAVEFVLEGMHLAKRLNRSEYDGSTTFSGR